MQPKSVIRNNRSEVCCTSYRSELSRTEERLAVHHAQCTELQKRGANREHICAEKIAEQQLRIKQVYYICTDTLDDNHTDLPSTAHTNSINYMCCTCTQARLHQKLMDVQYQLRMSAPGEGVVVRTSESMSHMNSKDSPHIIIGTKNGVSPESSHWDDINIEPSAVSRLHNGECWKMASPQVQHEIMKHEAQQSKV